MENPEEILHSLEEFAKMKPKDIPRELEDYLKFVAKTGDPVYQWSAIKSLFREKLINVITEFYESCSSMEIPPCPNVEMFNYELMKNFILEKLDTFGSAPFTLQRICELLTSPRKEYTRIDKYMRALEKNILVVSTIEPGGRRTENGDGVMNGIESDHEHVPEPGNEINVEEMDDSPSWPQNIQTNNHISEPISFENPEHEYHVSTSNQEIVCVQYVSVEPLASDSLQVQSEEVKESDISVTITALNVKKEEDEKPGEAQAAESEVKPVADISKETTETTDKQEVESDAEVKMDVQSVEPADDLSEDTKTVTDPGDVPSKSPPESPSEDISSTTSVEKPSLEPEQVQVTSSEPENADNESISPEVSPETSVTSSEVSPESNLPVDTSASDTNVETPSNSTPDTSGDEIESQTTNEEVQILPSESPTEVDSSTKTSEKVDIEDTTESEIKVSEEAVPKEDVKEELAPVQDTQKADADSSLECQDTPKLDTSDLSQEVSQIEMSSEPLVQEEPKLQTEEATLKVTPEKAAEPIEELELKSEEPTKSDTEESPKEEKETPMEVDVAPEDSSEPDKSEEPTSKEPETSEPPV